MTESKGDVFKAFLALVVCIALIAALFLRPDVWVKMVNIAFAVIVAAVVIVAIFWIVRLVTHG